MLPVSRRLVQHGRLIGRAVHTASSVDPSDIAHFSRLADEWWNEQGEFAALHTMNRVRVQFMREKLQEVRGWDRAVAESLGRDAPSPLRSNSPFAGWKRAAAPDAAPSPARSRAREPGWGVPVPKAPARAASVAAADAEADAADAEMADVLDAVPMAAPEAMDEADAEAEAGPDVPLDADIDPTDPVAAPEDALTQDAGEGADGGEQ